MKKLFRTHANQLRKVATKVAYSQRMDGGTIILGRANELKRTEAEQLLYKAIKILEEIL